MDAFPTSTVAEVTGATVRQIDHWARTGLLKPSARDASGKGSRRRYTFQDIIAVQAIQKLREGQCPLQKIRVAVRYLKSHYPNESHAQMLSKLTLLTDGKEVYLTHDERTIIDVVTKQMVWAVPLGKLVLETRAKVDALPQEWVEPVTVRGKQFHLDVARDEESGGFSVQCRELPGAIEQGDTAPEAVANGRAAIESVLDFLDRRKHRAEGSANVAAG